MLSVEDPNDPDNDLGKGSFNAPRIRQVAYQSITHVAVRPASLPSAPHPPGMLQLATLECILSTSNLLHEGLAACSHSRLGTGYCPKPPLLMGSTASRGIVRLLSDWFMDVQCRPSTMRTHSWRGAARRTRACWLVSFASTQCSQTGRGRRRPPTISMRLGRCLLLLDCVKHTDMHAG